MTKLSLILIVISTLILYGMALKNHQGGHANKNPALKATGKNLKHLEALKTKTDAMVEAKSLRDNVSLKSSMSLGYDSSGGEPSFIQRAKQDISNRINNVHMNIMQEIAAAKSDPNAQVSMRETTGESTQVIKDGTTRVDDSSTTTSDLVQPTSSLPDTNTVYAEPTTSELDARAISPSATIPADQNTIP